MCVVTKKKNPIMINDYNILYYYYVYLLEITETQFIERLILTFVILI